MREPSAVILSALEDAVLFVGGGEAFGNAAWLCRATGAVLCHSDDVDDDEPLPDDIDNTDRYLPIPDQHELGLGKPLALEFARVHLPDCLEQVYDIFSHRGAYARFKDLLDRRDSLDAWYQWEQEKTREALREWCADNGVKLAE